MNPVALLEGLFRKKAEYELFPLEAEDCQDMSALHAERFYRGWGDGEFYSLMAQSGVFGFSVRDTSARTGGFGGFVLAREAAGECEILAIAVSGKHSRQGLGWRLMQSALREARIRGGQTMFLEVDEGNLAAIGLYTKLGFRTVAQRKGYYAGNDGKKSNALVMRLDLG